MIVDDISYFCLWVKMTMDTSKNREINLQLRLAGSAIGLYDIGHYTQYSWVFQFNDIY